jgi:serine/threonine protein kinase
MSIEQLETTMKPFGRKVDVWSFGVIMLECLIKNSELFADKPASPFIMKCSNIISRCLSSDPQYRYNTNALVHALLDAFKLIDVEKIVRSDIPKIQPPPTPQSVKKQTSYKSPQKTTSSAPLYVSPNTTSYKSPSPIIRSPQSPPSDLSSSSYMSISKSTMSIGGTTKNKKKTKSSK